MLILAGLSILVVAFVVIRGVFGRFPLRGRRPLDGLLAGKTAAVEGFARGEPTLAAPLTGKPCLAYEIRGLAERRTHGKHHDTIWVHVGVPIAAAQAFELEDEEGDKRVHIAADEGVTFGDLGEAAEEQTYGQDHQTKLHQQIGVHGDLRTMLRQWVIEPLDQCAVAGMPRVRDDGSWAIAGDPRRASLVVLVPGTVVAARSKVLGKMALGVMLGVVGLGVAGFGVAIAVL